MRLLAMPFKTFGFVLVAGLLVCVDGAMAQPAANPTPVLDPQVGGADYEVGPGDELGIKVVGVREFDQSVRVSNSGRIRVPYVGIVFAAGMTVVELEREIAQKIRDHELVNEPVVRVQVAQQRARPAFIVGEVTTPGQFVITGDMYLLELITRAGGLTPGADATGLLYRRGTPKPSVTARVSAGDTPLDEPAPPPPPPVDPVPSDEGRSDEGQVIPINLDELREGTNPELNIPLQGGDVFYIPRRQSRTFYIIGDVGLPGAYNMPRRGDVTATQAIIYAGGPMLTAKNRSGFLMRHDASGVRQAIPVDFPAIVKGEKPDIPVQTNDIIFIPNSPVKTIGVGLLNLIPRLLQQFLIF
jgi:polysaccharide biosynthesis/export protein